MADPSSRQGSPLPRPGLGQRLRRHAGALVADGFFRGASRAGLLVPHSSPARHGLEVLRDVPYLAGGLTEHRLDVWRPLERSGPLPVVLYIHGGGFRILSKETHWIFGLVFARRGYVVFNISYRLAPRHPFPAALADAAAAYRFVAEHAAEYGGDPSRLVVAGESAGANLATSLAVAACYEREEPYARELFALGLVPRAVVPACGMLQVTDSDRFRRNGGRSTFLQDRISEVGFAYLGDARPGAGGFDLADPLLVLERGHAPARPLPAFFAPVGTWDPVVDDTRRLAAALRHLGVPHAAPEYERELHAFHAFVIREPARRCWQDTFEFLGRHV